MVVVRSWGKGLVPKWSTGAYPPHSCCLAAGFYPFVFIWDEVGGKFCTVWYFQKYFLALLMMISVYYSNKVSGKRMKYCQPWGIKKHYSDSEKAWNCPQIIQGRGIIFLCPYSHFQFPLVIPDVCQLSQTSSDAILAPTTGVLARKSDWDQIAELQRYS